jgi:hypothetical protein
MHKNILYVVLLLLWLSLSGCVGLVGSGLGLGLADSYNRYHAQKQIECEASGGTYTWIQKESIYRCIHD